MICLFVTPWQPERTRDDMVYDDTIQMYRLEYHTPIYDIQKVWCLSDQYPWKSFLQENGSRYTDLIRTWIDLPILVSEENFINISQQHDQVSKKIHYSKSQSELEFFLLFHQNIYVDRAIGISINLLFNPLTSQGFLRTPFDFIKRAPSVNQRSPRGSSERVKESNKIYGKVNYSNAYISPVLPDMITLNTNVKRLKGGVIIGGYGTYTSTTVMDFLFQGKTDVLVIIKDSDYHIINHIKKKYPHVSIWWEAKDIHSDHKQVIMNYQLWSNFHQVALQKTWNHVVLDEVNIMENDFSTKCLWIIDTSYTKTNMLRWVNLFHFPQLLGDYDFCNDDIYHMFLFYNVIYHHNTGGESVVNIQVSSRFIRFTNDYPLEWIYKALQEHSNIKELCKRILDLEYNNGFNILYFIEFFSNHTMKIPSFDELQQKKVINELHYCPVCQDEEATHFVVNNSCNHTLCYSCMFTVYLLQQKCPLCRNTYTPEFYKIQDSSDSIPKPTLWKQATTGRTDELIHLLEHLSSHGKVVVTSGFWYIFLEKLYNEVRHEFSQLQVVICQEFDARKIKNADIIFIQHCDLWYLRHDPSIKSLISMELDLDRSITRCMYYYFKSCTHKFVIAPSNSLSEILADNIEWNDEQELIQTMLSKIEEEY